MIGLLMLSAVIAIVAVAAWFTWLDKTLVRGAPLSRIGTASCVLVGLIGFFTTLSWGMGW